MLDEYPDATAEIDAGEHAETMVRVAWTVDDPGIVETAAEAVHLLALHRPAAVATRADAVLDLLDVTDPPHENELVVLYLLTALANILREDATAIAGRAEVVAASVDPPSAVTDATFERGIDVLSQVVGRPPRSAALVPHVELLTEAFSHTDDPDAVDDALRALFIITAAEDEPEVRPHADEIGTAVGRLDDWQTPIEGLDDAQQRYPELKLAVADVLAAALAERETVEPEQAEPVRTALVRIADGIEPPMATARITDILARVGSTVPPPHVADDVEPDEGGNHGDDTEQCGK
jgi:hypothetical protein